MLMYVPIIYGFLPEINVFVIVNTVITFLLYTVIDSDDVYATGVMLWKILIIINLHKKCKFT